MELKEAIQSSNLHAMSSHARAKADAVEAPPSKPKRWRLERGMIVEGEWEPHQTRGKSIRTIAKVHGECLADFDENGQLLAAASELLEALESCLGPLQDEYNRASHAGHATRASVAFLKAKQAILKAKGSL